jgi:hypothetical protein
MAELVRIPLDGGGSVLVEDLRPSASGPVRVGRVADAVDAIKDADRSLRAMLVPVRRTAQAVLDELRQACPDEVEAEFGISLSAEAGAVIAKATSAAHLTVRLTWRRDGAAPADPPAPPATGLR